MEEKNFLIDNILRVVRVLKKENINFCIGGGIAFSVLVEPRATVDIDVIIYLKKSDFAKIKKTLNIEFDNLIFHENLMEFKNIKIWRIIRLEEDKVFIIDFVIVKKSFFNDLIKRKKEIEFEEVLVPFIDIEDLYILKKMSERKTDINDLEKIENKYKKMLDWTYIKKWLKKLKE